MGGPDRISGSVPVVEQSRPLEGMSGCASVPLDEALTKGAVTAAAPEARAGFRPSGSLRHWEWAARPARAARAANQRYELATPHCAPSDRGSHPTIRRYVQRRKIGRSTSA